MMSDWTCPQCTLQNNAAALRCVACNAKNPNVVDEWGANVRVSHRNNHNNEVDLDNIIPNNNHSRSCCDCLNCVSFRREPGQTVFELHTFQRCAIYAVIQIMFMFIGLIFIFTNPFNVSLIGSSIIGGVIIILFCVIPNGKPFFLNLYRMGTVYIVFDKDKREIYLVSGRYGGIKYTNKLICSYSQFKGIAVHHQTKHILFLCRREESLLVSEIGEVLPNNMRIEDILQEIGLFWFSENSDGFFGVTYRDFEKGILAEGDVKVDVKYDYYLKRQASWKPKNNWLADQEANKDYYDDKLEDALSPNVNQKEVEMQMSVGAGREFSPDVV